MSKSRKTRSFQWKFKKTRNSDIRLLPNTLKSSFSQTQTWSFCDKGQQNLWVLASNPEGWCCTNRGAIAYKFLVRPLLEYAHGHASSVWAEQNKYQRSCGLDVLGPLSRSQDNFVKIMKPMFPVMNVNRLTIFSSYNQWFLHLPTHTNTHTRTHTYT